MKKRLFFLFLLATLRSIGQNHYVVTSAVDPANPFNVAIGQLRWAIEQANSHPGLDYIDFNIPSTPPFTIQLQSSLPMITSPIIIDGNTQPSAGYTGSEPKIWMLGNGEYSALDFRSSGNTAKNLLFNNFSADIVMFEAGQNNILNNVIKSSNFLGVLFGNCDGNIFRGNIFGTDHSFSTQASFSNVGIRLQGSLRVGNTPDNNIFGGLNATDMNLFYNMNNAHAPLDIQVGSGNKVSGNVFIHNAKNIDIYTNVRCSGNICKQPPVYQATTLTVQGTSIANDFIEVYLSNSTGIDAVQLLGTATANSSGQWSVSVTGVNAGDKIIATATDPNNNTSEFGPPSLATFVPQTPPPCTDCIGSFAPEAGDYILSAWVKEENPVPTTLTYTKPQIYIEFPNLGSTYTAGPFTAQGAIIDGWQRIEAKFIIPSNATSINLKLSSVTGNSFFDDVRIFPFDGSMKSYVYDPVNLRLVGELDERNYATMYEYDEEGKLIRVKKETEKGIMTIKENKNSTKKK
jgi:parallel beta-helix repeat protein/YD repeat-containing protein